MTASDATDVKVVVVGDSSVGKSAILKRFFDKKFEESTAFTIGIDFRHISYYLDDGTKVRLCVWDTAGQERFRQLAPSYVRDAHVILVVFDLTAPNILEQIARWTLFVDGEREEGALIVYVGNKCDLKQRRHDPSIITRMMAEYEAPYVETSAKTGFNVDELFSMVAHMPFPTRQRCQSAPIRLSSISNGTTWRPLGCCQ
ncbi:hypothetical protein RB195_009441 [Necator americanus]|uniref:Ras family protein n=1 Tax=Necator americanus TaxID=51031 RepID=A0ABR1CTA5_NECAM